VAVPDLRERWRTSFIEATTYDWAVEHEHVAGVLGRLVWGTETSAFYRDIARLSELPAGTSVLDIPCGGGVAFRGLQPAQELHYVAADLSPVMLGRARAQADRRGIHWIEFTEADVEGLPFEDRGFDLVATYRASLLSRPASGDPRDGAGAQAGRRVARHRRCQACRHPS